MHMFGNLKSHRMSELHMFSNLKSHRMNEEKNLSAPLCEMLVQQKHCTTVVLNNYTTSEDTNDIKPGVLTYNSISDDLNIKPCVLTAYSISDDLSNIKPVLNNSRATNVVKANVLLSYQTTDSRQAKTELVNDLIGLQMISSSINDCSVQLSNYTQNQFMNHENERQIPKSFLCQNTLNSKKNLKQNQHREIDSVEKSHMFDGPTKFDIVDKKYECDVCLAKFATRRYLRQHKTTSLHSDRRYQCNLCGKEITSNDLLKKHMRVHGKKKVQSKNKYRCDLCNKTFISEIHLEKHIKIHSIPSRRGQLFACDVCHKEFSVKKYLYLHKKTHSEKIFQCDLCDKRFALSRYLKSHANCHLIEKPHKCKFCNKSYATKDQLAIHLIKLHYFCETFTCTVCHEEFYQKKFIMKHIRMQHPTHAGNENLFIVTNKGFNVNVDEVLNGKKP